VSQGYDRYATAALTARIECLGYHPTGNCAHPRNIRLHVDGADWQIAEVGTALKHLTALPARTKDNSGDVRVPLTWAMVTQLSKLMEERGFYWLPDEGLKSWIFGEFCRRHDENGELKFDLSSLSWTPMPHQVSGAYAGAVNKRFFFGDDMRTGKTRTVLLTLAELEARGENPWPAVVVCPASVVDPWLEELETAFPDWPVTAYRGTRRRNLSSRYNIYVMSWNTFRLDMKHEHDELPPLLEFIVPKTLALDEAHCLCAQSKQSTAAMQCARIAEFTLLASGTPITRDIGGFYHAMNVMDIRSFPDPDRYKARYTDRSSADYGPDKVDGISTANREEFYVLIQGSLRRVAMADVNEDLPPKSYSTRVVTIPHAYRAAYDEMAKDMIAHIPDTDEPLEVMTILAQLQRLTQLASSACDVEIVMELDTKETSETFGEMVPRTHVTMREPSWKVDELMTMMDDSRGSPLIAFSPHTQLVRLAAVRAQQEGYRVGLIVGGQTAKQRTMVRRAFQGGGLDLLCANVTAGGVGLTLDRGDHVVFLERPWAYWQAHQAEARADDVRNAKQVHVTDIVATDTVESRVRLLLKDKARHLSDLVRDPRIVNELLGGQPLKV
jgi:SNF2 family DNA or RNA helicase